MFKLCVTQPLSRCVVSHIPTFMNAVCTLGVEIKHKTEDVTDKTLFEVAQGTPKRKNVDGTEHAGGAKWAECTDVTECVEDTV